MKAAQEISRYAALIGDPTRAAVLTLLLDGRAKTASELAMCSGASAQSLSGHLAKLLHGGLLSMTPQGRHRYYSLDNHTVAEVIEALALLSPPSLNTFQVNAPRHLCLARCCYDHIAGQLGVAIADSLQQQGWLRMGEREFELTDSGAKTLTNFGLEINALLKTRRTFARVCMDWTERRPHVAGSLGAALLRLLLDRHWIEHTKISRMLRITPQGHQGLADQLNISFFD